MFGRGKLTKIWRLGGSGRIRTGAMQFLNDWPGLFIRGDQAVVLGVKIRVMLDALKEKKVDDPRVWSAIPDLERLVDLIDSDVRVKSEAEK